MNSDVRILHSFNEEKLLLFPGILVIVLIGYEDVAR